MAEIYYKLSEKVNMEKMDEGAILSIEGSENVICLGRWECEILDLITQEEYGNVVSSMYDKYHDSSIENDMTEFCNRLKELGIIKTEN